MFEVWVGCGVTKIRVFGVEQVKIPVKLIWCCHCTSRVLLIYFRFGEYLGFDRVIFGGLALQVLIYLFGVYWI